MFLASRRVSRCAIGLRLQMTAGPGGAPILTDKVHESEVPLHPHSSPVSYNLKVELWRQVLLHEPVPQLEAMSE